VKKILLEAVNPEGGFDDAAFTARIRQTQWWQTNGSAARSWTGLKQTDPAQAQRQLSATTASLRQRAMQLGANVTEAELAALAERQIKFALTDAEMSTEFARLMADDTEARGAVASTMTQLRATARAYLVNLDENEITRWARGIASGTASADDFTGSLQQLAKAKFSGNEQLTKMIDSGMAPSSFFADYQRMIASEWDMSPEQVDLTDPRWASVLQTADGGKIRPMTLAESRKHIRSMEGWDQTAPGKAKIASSMTTLMSKLGKAMF
jgi:hypothetical protein